MTMLLRPLLAAALFTDIHILRTRHSETRCIKCPHLEGCLGLDSGRRERWGLDGDAAVSERGFQVLSPPCCISASCNTSTPHFPALIPLYAAKSNILPVLLLHSESNTWKQFPLSATLYITAIKTKLLGTCLQRGKQGSTCSQTVWAQSVP